MFMVWTRRKVVAAVFAAAMAVAGVAAVPGMHYGAAPAGAHSVAAGPDMHYG